MKYTYVIEYRVTEERTVEADNWDEADKEASEIVRLDYHGEGEIIDSWEAEK